MSDQHFINQKHREMIVIENDPDVLLTKMKSFDHPQVDKSAWALNLLNS
jgi:hypothetical protein